MIIARVLGAVAALTMLSAAPAADAFGDPPAWTQPTAPFHIAGNIYYVGAKGLAAYLITTKQGAILLDGTMPENVAMIETNIKSLGIKLGDVKVLLNSHAHFDHAGGLAGLKRDTGAHMMAMKPDVWALEHGTHFGDNSYGKATFPAVKVDRVLNDGDTVRLGGVTLTALLTPGHTAGCTTWTMTLALKSGAKRVVFPCSMTVAGNALVGNKAYPGIVADYRKTFDRMARLKADIVLTAHPEVADVLTRRAAQFVDPALLPKLVADARVAFDAELRRQQAAAK